MGGELARRFQALVAAQLQHMDREERELNALLWAHLARRRDRALSKRIVVSIPPARLLQVAAAGPAPRLERPGARRRRRPDALADLIRSPRPAQRAEGQGEGLRRSKIGSPADPGRSME